MSWGTLPSGDTFSLRNFSLPGAEGYRFRADIAAGRVAVFAREAATLELREGDFDTRGGLLLPCFVDIHTHLDKGLLAVKQSFVEGDLQSGITQAAALRDAFTVDDLALRMDWSLRAAYAHGTRGLRTHIDFVRPEVPPAWDVAALLANKWAGRMALQRVSLTPLDVLADKDAGTRIAATVARTRGVLGCFVYRNDDLLKKLERVLALAASYELELDFHIDEGLDPEATGLATLAQMVGRFDLQGRVVAGHCCSLAAQPIAQAKETLALCKEIGIALVTLPLTNVFLQGRSDSETPTARGITRLHEARAEGVLLAMGSDNHVDPFYPYGDLDIWQVFSFGAQLAHLAKPVSNWLDLITTAPAYLMGLPEVSPVQVGSPADFVLLNARNDREALARPQSDRLVMRGGQFIERTLPDFRELD